MSNEIQLAIFAKFTMYPILIHYKLKFESRYLNRNLSEKAYTHTDIYKLFKLRSVRTHKHKTHLLNWNDSVDTEQKRVKKKSMTLISLKFKHRTVTHIYTLKSKLYR